MNAEQILLLRSHAAEEEEQQQHLAGTPDLMFSNPKRMQIG